MVSFRLGEKRSIGAAGNAASGHKMFIAAGSDFSGGKVWVVKSEVLKHEPPPKWAAAGEFYIRYYASKKSMFVPKVPNDKTLQSFIGEGFFRNPLAEKILEPCTLSIATAPCRIFCPFFEFFA